MALLDVETTLGAIGQFDRAAPVMLGTMVLSGPEVPDELVIGGHQALVVHRVIGGGRVIDSLGNDPARLILSGRFMGPFATRRARQIEAMREKAQALVFSVADLSARVWIAAFSWSYQARGAICPYRLVLEREMVPPGRGEDRSDNIALNVRGGLSSLGVILGDMAEAGWTGANALSGLAGQVMPVAQNLGAGVNVARAQAALDKANGLLQSAMSMSRMTTIAASIQTPLSIAGSDLAQMRDESGIALDEGVIAGTHDFVNLAQNAGIELMGVEGGSHVARAQALLQGS